MSDYLGNLLKRVQGTTAEIRPRLRARFEPETSAAVHSLDAEEGVADQGLESRARSRSTRVPNDRSQDAAGQQQERAVDARTAGTISPPPDVPFTTSPPPTAQAVTNPLRTISVIENDVTALFSPADPSGPEKTARDKSPVGDRISPASPEDWQQVSIDKEETTPAAQAAPTINVTIGRVEVRAVIPSKTKPGSVPQRPAPRLSLDDYLAQRKDGRQ